MHLPSQAGKMSHETIDCPPNMEELTAFPTRSLGKINIPEQIGVKYKEFGIQLLEDSTGAKVTNIAHELRGNPKSINTHILEEWLQNGGGKKPVSWRTLVEVLRDIKLGTLANDIETACKLGKIQAKSLAWGNLSLNLWQNRKTLFTAGVLVCLVIVGCFLLFTRNGITQPSIIPRPVYARFAMDEYRSVENVAPGVAISTTTQSPILEYNKVLKDVYQKQYVTDPNQWLQVVMPFINLTLTEGNKREEQTIHRSIESQLHGRCKLSLDEVVNSVKKGSKILMKGRPGVGKTTMLRHIAKQWAEGKLLRRFQLVMLIRLGHIPSSRISNLESMLEYHSHDYPDTASVARELGRTGGEGICFLLDALDEYSPQTPTHNDYIHQLIRGDRLPNAALMVTSRPSASHSLQQSFTREIEVVGFLQHQIQQYINALPANSAATISEYIDQYKNLRHISYLPLHLAMMTYLAVHSKKLSLLDLDTETRIYHMFVNLTFRQRYKDLGNLDEVHSQAFSALSKAAFDATMRFSGSLRLRHLDPELMARVESFSIVSMIKQREGDKIGETFTFSHYTFQEFFTAYYLTALPHEEQMQTMKLHQHSSPLMWRFFFGLLRAHSSKNTTTLFETFANMHKSQIRRRLPNIVLMCAFELKQTAIADVLVQALNHSIEGSNHPSECAAFGYALSLNPHQFSKIILRSLREDDDDYWETCFISMFANLPESNGVMQVTITGLTISNRTISALTQFVRHFPNLQQLDIFMYSAVVKEHDHNAVINTLSYTETVKFATELGRLKHLRHLVIVSSWYHPDMVKLVATVLQHLSSLQTLCLHNYSPGIMTMGYDWFGDVMKLTSLKELILENFKITGRDAAKLAESIKHLSSLETLNLVGNGIGYEGVVALTGGIKSLTSLKALVLGINSIGDRGAAKLVEGIKHLTSLETLDLSRNEIGDRGAAKLAEGIIHLTSLEILNLRSNRVGDDGVVALTGGIRSLTSMKELDLSYNEVGPGGVAKLAESIKHLTSLETLNLASNRIGYEGVVALTGGIKNLTSLKMLDLSRNEIGERGAAKLAEGIKHLTSLETLNLAWNRIGVVALTEGLMNLTSLKTLDLSRNEIGDSGVAKLAVGIKHLTSLETLDLGENRIGDDGVVALTEGLKNLTSLKTLDL